MWESRHGIPVAQRRASGHRRYDIDDIARVQRVLDERRNGLSLAAAIDHVRKWSPSAPQSLFAAVRQHAPHLPVQRLPVRAMRAISHAIEDECLARAARPLVAGTFQHERAYRHAEHRWRELARTAGLAFVLADFAKRRKSRGAPAEIPLRSSTTGGRICCRSRGCSCGRGSDGRRSGHGSAAGACAESLR